MKRSPIKRSNPARKRKRLVEAFGSRERVEVIRRTPCVVCGVVPSENAHVRSRGAGGTWRDVVPLCKDHHREQHAGAVTFQARHQINLSDLAAHFAQEIAP
jgi:RNase P subunit RPR2